METYTLTITDDAITREQQNTPTISITHTGITQIREHNGSFVIKSHTPADTIIVPAQIEDHEQLATTLQNIHPITKQLKLSPLERYQRYIVLIPITLMVCFYTVNNKIVIALTGIPLIALLTWSFIKARQSKNIDAKTRKGLNWVTFVLVAITFTLIAKLIGEEGIQKILLKLYPNAQH